MSRIFDLSAGSGGIDIGTARTLHSNSAFAIIFWFWSPDNSGGSDFASLYGDGAPGPNDTMLLQMKQSGAISWLHRDTGGTTSSITSSSSGFDDSAWHWCAMLRRGATDYEMYIDGNSQGTNSTNVGAGTPTTTEIGNPSGANILTSPGKIAHFINIKASININEARSIAFGQFIGRALNVYMPLGLGSPEPDFSGNQAAGTVTNTAVGDNPPIRNPFGVGLFKPNLPSIVSFVPYPNPRYSLDSGMQNMNGGV
jgi:hypothetical protein